MTPDYRVRGRVMGHDGEMSFDYLSPHCRRAEPGPFYREILSSPPDRDTSRTRAPKQNLTATLRNWLRQTLPDYMIPASFVILKALPMTAAGKVDVRALPAPDTDRQEPTSDFVSPRTQLEWAIARVWQE